MCVCVCVRMYLLRIQFCLLHLFCAKCMAHLLAKVWMIRFFIQHAYHSCLDTYESGTWHCYLENMDIMYLAHLAWHKCVGSYLLYVFFRKCMAQLPCLFNHIYNVLFCHKEFCHASKCMFCFCQATEMLFGFLVLRYAFLCQLHILIFSQATMLCILCKLRIYNILSK